MSWDSNVHLIFFSLALKGKENSKPNQPLSYRATFLPFPPKMAKKIVPKDTQCSKIYVKIYIYIFDLRYFGFFFVRQKYIFVPKIIWNVCRTIIIKFGAKLKLRKNYNINDNMIWLVNTSEIFFSIMDTNQTVQYNGKKWS